MPPIPVLPRQQMAPPPDNAYCRENNKAEILGVTGALFTAGIIIVGLRMGVRGIMIKSIGADDYVMLSALVMAMATFIGFVYETKYAIGKHTQCIAMDDYTMYAKWQYYHSLWVMIGVVLVKISIALFLMRLVPPGKKWKRFLWGAIVFLICFCLSCMGTLIFNCTPIAASWDFQLRSKPSTRCFSNNTFTAIGLYNSSVNCATDFLFAALPIPIIVKLQVNRRTKITLAIILSLGYVACAAGIVKAVKQHNFFNETDPTWHNDFNVWNMIELCIGMIAASLPTLRPLFAKILETTKTALSSSRDNSSNRTAVGSSGYRRQRDIDGDIKMDDWKDFSNSTGTATFSTVKTAVGTEPDMHQASTSKTARHTLAMTDARDPNDDGSWEDIEVLRSQSEEALTRPAGIYKTTSIMRSCEPVEPGKRF
ncbi:hypothetical protein PRZ48_004679 [Zasmidium cellare]|uniref:Rhodopsin domain-containing protein n=1 Tax=Zasmidium cellare TaxID=395010 RepID=A0ABR0EQ77_ZASCE|nr:hypothetical protein PRZ48_004679 [Zasmidium cellare]